MNSWKHNAFEITERTGCSMEEAFDILADQADAWYHEKKDREAAEHFERERNARHEDCTDNSTEPQA